MYIMMKQINKRRQQDALKARDRSITVWSRDYWQGVYDKLVKKYGVLEGTIN
tara:strand:- start:398 stop:553 length:156 start_codon:yes stop_codon:yes gene_type:complete